MIDRALFGYEGQTDVLKLVSKGGLFNCLSSLFIIFVTVYSLIHNSLLSALCGECRIRGTGTGELIANDALKLVLGHLTNTILLQLCPTVCLEAFDRQTETSS